MLACPVLIECRDHLNNCCAQITLLDSSAKSASRGILLSPISISTNSNFRCYIRLWSLGKVASTLRSSFWNHKHIYVSWAGTASNSMFLTPRNWFDHPVTGEGRPLRRLMGTIFLRINNDGVEKEFLSDPSRISRSLWCSSWMSSGDRFRRPWISRQVQV